MVRLNQIRVASPCPVSWEQMTGDHRVRFCAECRLNVYNFAELTRTEAEELLCTTEGRICGRLYRRSDGTIITKDCPVGLRAARQRMAKFATAAFAALVSLCSVALGQKQSDKGKECKQQVRITTKLERAATESATLTGTVFDPNGAVIVRADIEITNLQTKEAASLKSNDEGRFSHSGLPPGIYEVLINASGFKQVKVAELKLAGGETAVVEATLLVNGEYATVGIIMLEPSLLDTPNMTIFKGDQIQKIPKPN
jgi:carboxypeptidase family protein